MNLNDPNDPMRAQILGLLSDPQHARTLAGAAQGGGLQLSPDAPVSSRAAASPADAFQLPQEAPPDPSVSHIDALMQSGLLTPTQGGQPVGGPPGGGPGGAGAPAAAAAKPHMIDKIHDWLMDKLGSNDLPPGYSGLLAQAGVSPDEVQAAKPTLGHKLLNALVGPSQDEDMRNHLNQVVQLHQATAQMAAGQQQMGEAARLRGVQQHMTDLFPPLGSGASEEQKRSQLIDMYGYLVRNGDLEGAKELGSTYRAVLAQPHAPTVNPDWQEVKNVKGDPNGPNAGQTVTQILDKRTNKVIQEIPEAPAPKLPLSADASQGTINANNRTREEIANSFTKDMTPFNQALSNYRVVQSATKNPSKTSMMAALTGYVHLISPTVRGVGQIMPFVLKNTGSLSDKFQRYLSQNVDGKPEPGFFKEIQDAADAIMQEKTQDYEASRQSHLLRGDAANLPRSEMDKILPPSPVFGKAATPTGTTTGKTAADLRAALQKK